MITYLLGPMIAVCSATDRSLVSTTSLFVVLALIVLAVRRSVISRSPKRSAGHPCQHVLAARYFGRTTRDKEGREVSGAIRGPLGCN